PQGARVAPNINPGAKGPARFGTNQPGIRAPRNQPGSRGLGNQPGGFTSRDPRLRAVNARTPQLRQVQRSTHRSELFAIRSRMPVRPLPGERNFTGVPPIAENRFVSTEMVCQWGPDMTQAGIEQIARQHNLTVLGVQRSSL